MGRVSDYHDGVAPHTSWRNKKGNVKYYILVSDGVNRKEVSVSKSNAESGVITLVKWVDDETGKIRYTTRSGKKRAVTPDIDLNKVTTE